MPSTTLSLPAYTRSLIQLTRLHKFPVGNLVSFWPSGFGLAMAAYYFNAPAEVLFKNVIIFAIVTTMSHSAFCVWNDICDRDFDAKVERTRNRPLVTGAVSMEVALALALSMVLVAVGTSFLASPDSGFVLLSTLPIHFLYPLMKRWTWWPQAWLGFGISTCIPMAWTSLSNKPWDLEQVIINVILGVGVMCWFIFFDTIYGTQDRKDDEKAGVKSTARLFGSNIRPINFMFGMTFALSLFVAGFVNGNGLPFFVITCLTTAIHIAWQILTWRVEDAHQSAVLFKSNGDLGYAIFIGMVTDYALRA